MSEHFVVGFAGAHVLRHLHLTAESRDGIEHDDLGQDLGPGGPPPRQRETELDLGQRPFDSDRNFGRGLSGGCQLRDPGQIRQFMFRGPGQAVHRLTRAVHPCSDKAVAGRRRRIPPVRPR